MTDDERREVARGIREVAGEIEHLTSYTAVFAKIADVMGSVSGRYMMRDKDMLELLADLIEPKTSARLCPECGEVCLWPSWVENCPHCDAELPKTEA